MKSLISRTNKAKLQKRGFSRTISLKVFFAIRFLILVSFFPHESFAQKKNNRKVQEVNFAEMSLKGSLRNPEGAFLVQKRGIRFLPLYDVQKSVDEKIRESSDYVK